MDERTALSRRELTALRTIDAGFVGTDYWEDDTIRLYRALKLVFADGERIRLTAAGMQAILMDAKAMKSPRRAGQRWPPGNSVPPSQP